MIGTDHTSWPTSALIEAAYREQHEFDDDGPWPATVALHERGSREVLEAALTLCTSLDPKWRSLGARLLGELGSPERTFPEECCDTLLGLLSDPSQAVVISAIYALGHLGNRRCDSGVLALQDHPEPAIRKGVAFALSGTSLPEAVPVLLKLMEDPDVEARDWATTTLGQASRFDNPEIREALLARATKDDDEIVRGEALHGLAWRGDKRCLPLLVAELEQAGDHAHLFVDGAKLCLGIDEMEEVAVQDLLADLRADRH
ncbi:MAG TPA: HEAT repeat domain-containing protein [Reyranella sp.]|jgi:HEAT repeat protein